MKASLKKAWVKALRSGKYNQGQGRLCSESLDGTESFCCLGVLADIALDTDWVRMRGKWGGDVWGLPVGLSGYLEEYTLPLELSVPLGIDYDTRRLLEGMNDDGKSFDEIADEIEKHL